MHFSESAYAFCSLAFLILIALIAIRGRISRIGLTIICACLVTSTWAAAMAVPSILPGTCISVVDGMRLSAWLIVAVALVSLRRDRARVSLPLLLTIGCCVLAVGYEVATCSWASTVSDVSRSHDFVGIGFGVGGLLATENLLRNSDASRKQQIWPLCLALGALFSYELFLNANFVMARSEDAVLASGRAVVGVFAVPLLAMAMARNREWQVDIHVSRA